MPKTKTTTSPAREGLEQIRIASHRHMRELRLRSLEEAARFVEELGIVVLNPGSELPSLLGAVLGSGERPKGKGFQALNNPEAWKAWEWFAQLDDRKSAVGCKIFRGQSTLVHKRLWPAVHRLALDRLEALRDGRVFSKTSRAVVDWLANHGPERSDRVREAMGLASRAQGKELKKAKDELASHGLLLLSEDTSPEHHTHAPILTLWTAWAPKEVAKKAERMSAVEARAEVLCAAMDAAVLASERAMQHWFRWDRLELAEAIEHLVAANRVRWNRDGKASFLASGEASRTFPKLG